MTDEVSVTRRGAIKMGAALVAGTAWTVGRGTSSLALGDAAPRGGPHRAPETIEQAGRWLRAGHVSSVELTQRAIDCARALEPRVNAFITITEEQALAAAAERDRELTAGIDRGALHGIPIVHKDLFDTAGVRTTVGSRVFAARVPDSDATIVARLGTAGAVSIGKTNMNEFAAGVSGENLFHGHGHNPWDLDRSAGGSSTGTGIAIATGTVLAGTGSDTGGSIRVPASWDGIVGIRPTYGLVSLHGVFPRAPSLDVAGPLGRTVYNVAAMLTPMAGYDPQDPRSLNVPSQDYTSGLDQGVRGLRLAVLEDYSFRDVDADVAREVARALETFESLGAEVTTVRVDNLAGPLDYATLLDILLYEFGQVLGDVYWSTEDKSVFGPIVQANMERSAQISPSAYEDAIARREQDAAPLKAVFNDVDLLVTPTMPTVAPPLQTGQPEYDRGRQFTLPFSYVGVPSASVPCGLGKAGMPVGLQLVGAELSEKVILRAAAALEATGPLRRERPPVRCISGRDGAR